MGGVSVTSRYDDVKILRDHDVTSLAVSILIFNVYNNFSSNRAGNYSVVLKMSLSMRKIEGSITRPVKLDIV